VQRSLQARYFRRVTMQSFCDHAAPLLLARKDTATGEVAQYGHPPSASGLAHSVKDVERVRRSVAARWMHKDTMAKWACRPESEDSGAERLNRCADSLQG
jgi:hypothetical protein